MILLVMLKLILKKYLQLTRELTASKVLLNQWKNE